MAEALSREDWARISEALSHFRHNPQFEETYQKIRAILGEGSP